MIFYITYGTERWVCRCRLLNIITSENTIWRKNYNILNCLIQCQLIDCGLLSHVFHTYHIFNAKSSWWEMISRRGNSYFCVVGVLFFSFSISVTLNIFWSEKQKSVVRKKKYPYVVESALELREVLCRPVKNYFFLNTGNSWLKMLLLMLLKVMRSRRRWRVLIHDFQTYIWERKEIWKSCLIQIGRHVCNSNSKWVRRFVISSKWAVWYCQMWNRVKRSNIFDQRLSSELIIVSLATLLFEMDG